MLKFVIFFIFFITTIVPTQAHEKYEVRATWLTTLGGLDWPVQKASSAKGIERQKAELCALLDKLKDANFNTVFFQTRLRGDVIYPSYLESYSACLTGKAGKNPGYDPLQFAIDECHKRGLALHAWIVAIPIGSKRQVKLLGEKSVVVKKTSLCKLFNGNWYLDPGEPAVSDYLSHLVQEITARYDVDGIHFDYMRYPEHGKRFPDHRTYQKYGKDKRGKRISLEAWRRENITRIVRRLYTEIKNIKPWIIVSSSPIGKYNDTKHYRSLGWNAYSEVHQEAQLWLKEGIHDALFPMMYFKDNHFFPFALDWQENKNNRWIVPGLGIYFLETNAKEWQLDEVLRQIHFTREQKLDGQAYFRNQFLMKNVKGIWDEINQQLYTTPAVTPPLTWLDSIAPATPELVGFSKRQDTRLLITPTNAPTAKQDNSVTTSVSIVWKASATQKRGGIHYRIYASNKYPVDIQRGENIIATSVRDSMFTYTPKLPWQQKLYWAVTAVDRYGNESAPLICNLPQNEAPHVYENELPAIPKDGKLIITDMTGRSLLETKEVTSKTLEHIPSGFYRISIQMHDGKKKLVGTLIR